MGAVVYSLDVSLVECLKRELPLSVFVETGTFQGDTVARMVPYFDRLITIELSEPLWMKAKARFAEERKVHVHLGDSAQVLPHARASVGDDAALYWLDAHWCIAENTAGDKSQCPLLNELAAIKHLGSKSVILIDDARLFLAPPPEPHEASHWPSFDEVFTALRQLSSRHELMVVNDVIAYYPKTVRNEIRPYARKHGVDWLRASQSLAENAALRMSVEEKEAAIQSLHTAAEGLQVQLRELDKSVREKEEVIQAQQRGAKSHENRREQLERTVAEKDAVIQALRKVVKGAEIQRHQLMKGLQEKEAVIQSLHKAVHHFETQQGMFAKSLEEKELAIQSLNQAVRSPQVHLLMVKALEEKEAVIQELRRAVNAYRSAFSLFGFLIWPLNYVLLPIRRFGSISMKLLKPRLGTLNQHEPREISLRLSAAPRVNAAATPHISIVTPSFKQAGFIERTLRSVLDQQYPKLEYVVQDGGSDDGTREILERYTDRLAAWESLADSGQTQAINRGFAKTTGEIMAWLNSDDILLPGALAYVADYFTRHPDIDVVYGHRILIDESDRQIGRWIMPAHSDEVLSWADYIPQETLFWRRRIWEKAGGKVDESFRFAMDWDLLVRFREAGGRFARLPRFLGGFRIHEKQKTSAAISDIGFQEMNRIRERVLGRVPSTIEVRKAVMPYLLKHVATDLGWRIRNTLGVPS